MSCLDCPYLKIDFPKPYFCAYKKIQIDFALVCTTYLCFNCEIFQFIKVK